MQYYAVRDLLFGSLAAVLTGWGLHSTWILSRGHEALRHDDTDAVHRLKRSYTRAGRLGSILRTHTLTHSRPTSDSLPEVSACPSLSVRHWICLLRSATHSKAPVQGGMS